jgi:hypothetical protein
MDAGEREALAELMARMAAGDTLALFTFLDVHRSRLTAAVRRLLAPFGRTDVLRDPAQLDALVQSAALVIFDNAAAWDPTGAMPWTWAERAIRAEIVAWIGHPSIELTDAEEQDRGCAVAGDGRRPTERSTVWSLDGGAGAGVDLVVPQPDDGLDDLTRLAGRERTVALLLHAIVLVASERDVAVHIQYRVQKGLGDRSPAHTVAAEFGLQPDNVRQIDHRVRRKVRALIERNATFEPLRDLHWLAA